jgi:hypothetical protein
MKTLLLIVLITHVISGTVALTTGLLSMLNRKGGKNHLITGKIFFWGMTGVFITAVTISIAKSLLFLFLVGFFSYYLACSGYRSLYLKKIHQEQKAALIDWVIGYAGLFFGFGLIIYSIIGIPKNGSLFTIVPIIFGVISLLFAYADIRKFYIRPTGKSHWLVSHAMKMSGAFSATVTAFVVVNIQINQQWVLWILPAAIIPTITRFQLKRMLSKSESPVFRDARVISNSW